MRVWVVSSGYYSDFTVLAIFSSKASANEYAELVDEETIEEFELDEFAGKFPKGKRLYWVWMDFDGSGTLVFSCDPELNVTAKFDGKTDDLRRHTKCWARDEKHAIKIANDRRTQAIANGEWQWPTKHP